MLEDLLAIRGQLAALHGQVTRLIEELREQQKKEAELPVPPTMGG
jgi:hypothetical protein